MEAITNKAVASRAIEQIFSPHGRSAVSRVEHDAVVIEFKGIDRRLLSDLTAGFSGVIEEDSVEFGSQDLVRRWALCLKAIAKIKSNALAAGGNNLAPIFDQETARIDFFSDSHSFESVQSGRQRRLADARSGEILSFSKMTTRRPAFARRVPAELPAGPPPMIATSNASFMR